MKAILVEFSLLTRIIVPDDFDVNNLRDEDYNIIREKAIPKFHEKLDVEGVGDLLIEVSDDKECPYDENVELTEKELGILKNK